jgi:hypothetical protein
VATTITPGDLFLVTCTTTDGLTLTAALPVRQVVPLSDGGARLHFRRPGVSNVFRPMTVIVHAGDRLEDHVQRISGTPAEILAAALAADDAAEDAGMHADDRLTCWSCKTWADHAHDLYGRRITLDEYNAQVTR